MLGSMCYKPGHRKAVLLLLVAGWLPAACSDEPVLPPLSDDAVILAFGNSLTYGSGAGQQEAYPAVLSRMSGRRVVNAGVPGEVTVAGLQRLPGVLETVQPDLLILCHGGNDMLRKHPHEQTARNIRSMLELARARGIAVLLVAVPEPGLLLSAPPFYEQLADQMRIPVETDILADVLANPGLKSDRIHPNAEGYQLLAQAVKRLMQQSGAL